MMDYIQPPTGDLALDAHLKHVYNVNWTSTPLGSLDQWPKEIFFFLWTVMTDPNPRLLLLGPDSNMLYNPAYGELAGDLHPRLLGMPVSKGWPAMADIIDRIYNDTRTTGIARVQENIPLLCHKNETIEELILDWCIVPLKGPLGGLYVSLTDVTEPRMCERRQALLRTLSDTWSLASDISSLWSSISRSLSLHPHEFPLALLYSATLRAGEHSHDFVLDARDAPRFALKSFVGQPSARPLLKTILEVDDKSEPIEDAVHRAIRLKEPQLLRLQDGTIPEAWIRAAHTNSCASILASVVINPIKSNRTGVVVGVLILGLNTSRAWKEAQKSWILDFGKELNDVTTSLLLAEDAARTQHDQAKQAAREQVLLTKELASREREATDANDQAKRLLKMMEDCDVGIFEYSPDGILLRANEAWYQLSGCPKVTDGKQIPFSFMDYIYEDDLEFVKEKWTHIAQGNQTTVEMRWKPKAPGPGEEPPEDGRWVSSSCIPIMDENGNLVAISGCITDIDSQKRVARDAIRRAEALERARASEKMADIANERFQRLTKAIDLIDVGVFEYSPDGMLLSANNAYHNISGLDESATGPLPFGDAVYPADHEFVMKNWRDMVQGIPSTFEMRWKAPSKANQEGQEPSRWVLAACMPATNEEGVVTNIFGCITDIDAQKRRAYSIERARASEQRFVRFTESSAAPIYIVEYPSKKLTYCNDAWFNMTGIERAEFDQIDWSTVIMSEDMPLIDQLFVDIVEKRDTVSVQFRLKRMWTGANGEILSPFWIMATANPEFNEDGTVKGVMGTMADITGFKWLEMAQQLRIDEALESKRQQENFIDMTSHEIRNPLGAVVHCADSIADSLTEMKALSETLKLTEKVERLGQLFELIESSTDAVNTIIACTSHLKRIVDDILVLSKLDSNLLQIAPSSVLVVDVLKDLDNMFEAESQRSGVRIKTELDPSLANLEVSYALLDAGRALQILINLVTNAIKFTRNRKKRQVTVRMGASKERPSESELHVDFALSHSMRDSIYDTPEFADNTFFLFFKVTDTGRGMTPEEKGNIFMRFSQGSPKTYSEYGGSGLGLFISRELAGLQGGEIGVASEAGKGSTFAFFIQTRHIAAPKVGLTSVPPVRTNSGSIRRYAAPHEVSVLVTEDNLLNQKVLKKQLTKHGYNVYTADNGQEALDFLKTTKCWKDKGSQGSSSVDIDVILMDIEMPVMNGLESARRIREYQKEGSISRHIPIIACSANARPEQTNMALSSGMDDAISKPYRIVDLMPKIDKLASWAKSK